MGDEVGRAPYLPPRWFIHLAWRVHRALYRATGGRVGLWRPRGLKWGTLRLTVPGESGWRSKVGLRDRKSTRLNSSHSKQSRMPSSA